MTGTQTHSKYEDSKRESKKRIACPPEATGCDSDRSLEEKGSRRGFEPLNTRSGATLPD